MNAEDRGLSSLRCREIRPSDDLAELTDLLHAAYAPLAAKGLRFWATHQTVVDTASRLAEGHGFVGTINDRVIATITVRPPQPQSAVELLREEDTWSFGQFAVHPTHQGHGHGKRLHDFVLQFAVSKGCRRMALDTAEPARSLVEMYQSWGYVRVGHCDWRPHTNYVSVLMVKPLQ